MKQYERVAQMYWEEVDKLAKTFASRYPIILECDTERDDTSMYFRFRFAGGYTKEYAALFKKYDSQGEYDSEEEINWNGWATIPQEPTINMVNELGFFEFRVTRIVATMDWVYFLGPKLQ